MNSAVHILELFYRSLVTVALPALLLSCGAQDEGNLKPIAEENQTVVKLDEEPGAWSIRSYQITTAFQFDMPGAGLLDKLPESLSSKAGAEEIQRYIRLSSKELIEILKTCGIDLPEGSLAIYDEEGETLAVRTIGHFHQKLEEFEAYCWENECHLVRSKVEILEAPASIVLRAVGEAAGKVDHGFMLEDFYELVAEGKARLVNSALANSRPGHQTMLQDSSEQVIYTKFWIDSNGMTGVGNQVTEEAGLKFEVLPVYGGNINVLKLGYSLEFPLAEPTSRSIPVGTFGEKQIELPVEDFHKVDMESHLNLKHGQTRLIGVWPARHEDGKINPDNNVAAFISAQGVPVLKRESTWPSSWLKEHGENVAATPPEVDKTELEQPVELSGDEMYMRLFRDPAGVVQSGWIGAPRSGPVDPFEPESIKPQPTIHEALKARGIEFPEGAHSGSHPSSTSTFYVFNTHENMKKVEALVEKLADDYSVQFVLRIVQAEQSRLRNLERDSIGKADHTAIWQDLEKEIEAGKASIVRIAWADLDASGVSFKINDVADYAMASGMEVVSLEEANKQPEEEKKTPGISVEVYQWRVGFEWEVLPVVGADRKTIDLAHYIHFDTAPPVERFEPAKESPDKLTINSPEVDLHEVRVGANTAIRSGMMSMVGMWKPKGVKDQNVLHVAFLEAHVVRALDHLDEQE